MNWWCGPSRVQSFDAPWLLVDLSELQRPALSELQPTTCSLSRLEDGRPQNALLAGNAGGWVYGRSGARTMPSRRTSSRRTSSRRTGCAGRTLPNARPAVAYILPSAQGRPPSDPGVARAAPFPRPIGARARRQDAVWGGWLAVAFRPTVAPPHHPFPHSLLLVGVRPAQGLARAHRAPRLNAVRPLPQLRPNAATPASGPIRRCGPQELRREGMAG